jgi:hypothetical protein
MQNEETEHTQMLSIERYPSFVGEDEFMDSDISYESQFEN